MQKKSFEQQDAEFVRKRDYIESQTPIISNIAEWFEKERPILYSFDSNDGNKTTVCFVKSLTNLDHNNPVISPKRQIEQVLSQWHKSYKSAAMDSTYQLLGLKEVEERTNPSVIRVSLPNGKRCLAMLVEHDSASGIINQLNHFDILTKQEIDLDMPLIARHATNSAELMHRLKSLHGVQQFHGSARG